MTDWWTVLADPPPEKVTPGVLGFTVMFLLALATLLLIRSMVGHLRKVRYGPGGPDGPPDPRDLIDPADPAGPAGAGGTKGATGSDRSVPERPEGSAPGQVEHQ
jgi:hypothetical protein